MRRIALLATLALAAPAPGAAGAEAPADALHQRVLAELGTFTTWLTKHGVRGYIGEVGWPDDARGDGGEWNELAEAWYDAADSAQLSVSYWATGEWWGKNYLLAGYEDRNQSPGVDTPNTQSAVIEAHPSGAPGVLRGIVDAGGEFGYAPTTQKTSPFSNANPGKYGTAYHYDKASTFAFLASRGVGVVKIPFRWERLQPRTGRQLDRTELERIREVVDRAFNAGLGVILDMHNFGAYYVADDGHGRRCAIGQRDCTVGDFADVWSRIARAFRARPVLGYTLMTEPVDMVKRGKRSPMRMWQRASQAAVTAIRKVDDDPVLFVSGYQWSGTHNWTRWNPEPWINDPAGNFMYEAHHYWDRDHSGTYRDTYAEEVDGSA